MVGAMSAPPLAARPFLVLGLLALAMLAAGCGSQQKGADGARLAAATAAGCPATVLSTLGSVLGRVYREGVASERTRSARKLIERSLTLRAAVEADDPAATRAAARALLATGHMSSLVVRSSSHTLAATGAPALAPLNGTLKNAAGRTIGSYVTSVWSDRGFLSEGDGLAQASLLVRRGRHTLAGSLALGPLPAAAQGTVSGGGTSYRYTSLPVTEYPGGGPLTVYVLKTARSIDPLCGSGSEETLVKTLSSVARGLYTTEGGRQAQIQVRRVQRDASLLRAVAAGDRAGTRRAIAGLLNHHIVRLRVSGRHGLLADVGGPYVLQPVSAPLRLGGRRIGTLVLSIQDDEGYLRLARRLAGLSVLMYMDGGRLVKNSLGAGAPGAPGGPRSVPASGRWVVGGRTFRVYTINGRAFPAGPLTIRVLIPIPYS